MSRITVFYCASGLALLTLEAIGQDNGFFSGERLVPNLNTFGDDIALRTTLDGLEGVFKSTAGGNSDIWMTRRESSDADFGPPELLSEPVNSSADEFDACISADGLEIYFNSRRSGNADIWMAWRADRSEPFAEARPLAEINTNFIEGGPSISTDRLSILFQSDRPGTLGGRDLWVASRSGIEDPFGDVKNLGSKVNTALSEFAPCISFDGSTLLFARSDFASIPADIYISRLTPGTLTFSTPAPLRAPVNSSDWDSGNALSADWPTTGAKIYFGSYRPGGFGQSDIWEATWTEVLGDLHCVSTHCGAELQWSNPSGLAYEALAVRRGTKKIADLDPGALVFTDEPVAGNQTYTVVATFNHASYFLRCEVNVACTQPRFLRGECNADGNVDISDAVCALDWLFLGGTDPGCLAALDSNGDGSTDLSDAVWVLGFLFLGGPPPVAPFPDCGEALPSDGKLGCAAPPAGCN